MIQLSECSPDELETWASLSYRGFLSPTKPSAWRIEHMRKQISLHRLVLARIGGVPCGSYCTWDLDLPVPGAATVRTRAIGSLSVLTSHRRRGVARAFIEDAVAGARQAGAPLCLLIPSEAPIYGRYGFGAATHAFHLTVDSRRVSLPSGNLVLESTDDVSLRQVAPPLYEAVAAQQPGALPRPDPWWDRNCGLVGEPGTEDQDRPAVIARTPDGTVVGTASYRISGDWELDSKAGIELLDLTAATPLAYGALWGYLADIGLTDRIVARDRPVHEPLPWLLPDRRAVTESHRTDFQWIRILDVPAALTARTASAPGSLVLDVVDPAGLAAGRWLLDASVSGEISVSSTSRSADLTVPIQTLASLYLGQNSLLAMGFADEHRSGAARLLDQMLTWAPSGVVGHTWF